ncbi:unnamed protein product [Leptidea sinapis]|uniref:Uncharacterized protein n=1 Tax=Leptidea sinapis TaxID=189913 RepID=A0A5E4Q4Q7_9NEOP|nr:unnamed protein product [Leptidea sinapis]
MGPHSACHAGPGPSERGRAPSVGLSRTRRHLSHTALCASPAVYIAQAESIGQGGGKRASEAVPRSIAEKQQQHRPSLISMLVGRGLPRTPDHPQPLCAQRGELTSTSD